MNHRPVIRAVMTPFPHAIGAGADLAAALRMMEEHGIRHLPVTEGERLVGIVSERGIRRAQAVATAPDREALRVASVCAPDPLVVDVLTPLDRVLATMASRHLDAALVVKSERLVGIFTGTDACRTFSEFLRSVYPSPEGGDAA
jgi:acetoin utilization protein AcuB